jgi:hypothetical protein
MNTAEEANFFGVSAAIASQAGLCKFLITRGIIDRADLKAHAESMIAQLEDGTPQGKASGLPYRAIITAIEQLPPEQFL